LDNRIIQAVQGDQGALGSLLFEAYSRLSSKLAGKIPDDMRSLIDEDDVLQLAFVDVYRGIRQFEPKSDRAFQRWLETVVEHQLLDVIRAHRTKKRGGDRRRVQPGRDGPASSVGNLLDWISADIPTPSANVRRDERLRVLQVQLAGLPDDYRQAIHLRHLEGMSLDEVAVKMNRKPSEVRGILYRALRKLRDAIGDSSFLSSG